MATERVQALHTAGRNINRDVDRFGHCISYVIDLVELGLG
jgi:hypothetical protein